MGRNTGVSLRSATQLLWAVPALAMLMLVITLIPADLWRAPANDAVYSGFDPNIIFTSAGGLGVVRASQDAIDMTAAQSSNPSANLATTLRRNLNASIDVTVYQTDQAVEPFRIGFWSPWTTSGFFIAFGPGPLNAVTADTIVNGAPGPTLIGGDIVDSTVLGHYQLGKSYRVAFSADRAGENISAAVAGDGVNAQASLNSAKSPAIFTNVQLSLTASASSLEGTSHVALTNYTLTLPHEPSWASSVHDAVASGLVIALTLLGILAVAVTAIKRRRIFSGPIARTRIRLPWLVFVAVGLYLVGNVLLFPLGAHPFDFGDEKLYAYVARAYGPSQLFFLPDVTSLASIWGGVPYVEAAFPYGPVVAYLFTGIGWLNSLLFAGGGIFGLASAQLGYVIKSVNVLFGLADAALIYAIMREIKVSQGWSRVAAALFLFNPAVWFSMSIWGQTHVISLFLVLAAVLMAEKHLPFWAWLALAAACLTRPQMVVFGLLLGIVFLRKFSWRENLSALSWTVIVTFVLLTPLTLATSPSLPVDIMLHNFHVQEAGGNQTVLTTVSQDAYSLWPLITYLVGGVSGVQRVFTPSSTLLLGSATYQQVSQVLTLAVMLVISAALLLRKRAGFESGAYLPLVALGITSFLMLLTGIVATHFLLALPFLLLCRPRMSPIAYFYVATIWTITTFVPMFGDLGVVLSGRDYPLLAHSAITRFFVTLYSWDRFITLGVVANICAVIWLALLTFRTPAAPAAVQPPAAAG